MSGVIEAIGLVSSVLTIVSFFQDLFAGGAQSMITLNDLRDVVRGEHAQFFTTITYAEIELAKSRFQAEWLPTVADFYKSGITKAQLSPGGSLYDIYTGLLAEINNLDLNLNLLFAVFQTYHRVLHIDELIRGYFAFAHAYALLFHMYAVHAELHRIL